MDVVASPCTKICRIAPGEGLCEGCGRTLDEIAGWMALPPDHKRAVVAMAARRLAEREAGRRV